MNGDSQSGPIHVDPRVSVDFARSRENAAVPVARVERVASANVPDGADAAGEIGFGAAEGLARGQVEKPGLAMRDAAEETTGVTRAT